MVSSRSRPKRQTRLTFTPLPSSSPASAAAPVRDRAAAVGYEGSPGKRRMREPDVLPTPERSSQFQARHSKSHKSFRSSKLPASDSTSSSSEEIGKPSSRSWLSGSKKMGNVSSIPGEGGAEFTVTVTPSSGGADTEPSGKKVTETKKRGRGTNITQQSSSESTSSSNSTAPKRRKMSRKERSSSPRQTRSSTRLNRASSPTNMPNTEAQTPSRRRKSAVVIPSSESSSDEDDDMPTTAGTSARKRRKPARTPDFVVDDDDNDLSEEPVVSSPAKRSKRGTRGRASKATAPTIDTSSDEDETDSEVLPSTSQLRAKARQPRRGKAIQLEEDEASDVSEESDSRRAKRENLNRQDQEDLEEDLDFLRSSPVRRKEPRSSAKKNAKLEALQALKQRRANKNALPSSSRRTIHDSDDDSEIAARSDAETDDSEVEEVQEEEPDAVDMFVEDDQDEGFIDSDEDETMGAPAQLPLAFSNVSRMKGKDLFKYAVEWMVQKKINPAFAMDDEIYGLTFRKLDDEVQGLAGSKFTSSTWKEDFRISMLSRPQITVSEIPRDNLGFYTHHCDACNRTNRPATFTIHFYGKPYHKQTLENVEDDEDEDDEDEEEDRKSYNAQGQQVPSENTFYHVGRFCMQNARTAHTLTHWRYHLYEWVVDYLKSEGHTSPDKIIARDSWSIKRRRDDANHIVDEMEQNGQIRKLHHDFRVQINEARESKQPGRWG